MESYCNVSARFEIALKNQSGDNAALLAQVVRLKKLLSVQDRQASAALINTIVADLRP